MMDSDDTCYDIRMRRLILIFAPRTIELVGFTQLRTV